MEALKKVFQEKNQTVSMALSVFYIGSQPAQTSPALVTFVTAGYPKVEDTVPILLSMQEGGADIIELGVPFKVTVSEQFLSLDDEYIKGPSVHRNNDNKWGKYTQLVYNPLRALNRTRWHIIHGFGVQYVCFWPC